MAIQPRDGDPEQCRGFRQAEVAVGLWSRPRLGEPSVARRVVTRRRHAPGVGGASCPHMTEKPLALVAVPAGVVTVIGPDAAPAGTVAVILIGELTVNTAEVPLNFTAVAPVRFAPLMATLVPGAPLAGVKLVIRGATVKLVALVAVPPGVVTLIGPVRGVAGTVAVICVPLLTMNVAASPLNLTAVAPGEGGAGDRDAGAAAPLAGENELTVGATVKVAALVRVPAGVVTLIGPVVAPAGTVAVILIAEFTVNTAEAPLKVTAVAPVKFAPLTVTLAPTAPLAGVNAGDPWRHREGRPRWWRCRQGS